jgi:hypothetical protein
MICLFAWAGGDVLIGWVLCRRECKSGQVLRGILSICSFKYQFEMGDFVGNALCLSRSTIRDLFFGLGMIDNPLFSSLKAKTQGGRICPDNQHYPIA